MDRAATATRLTLGPLQNPVRGALHGSAALAAIGLALHLGLRAGAADRWALLCCALAQFGLYLTSSLYHSLPWGPVGKARMQRLDHSMIYFGIAGTMTPIVWLGLDDWRRGAILAAAWAIALLGAGQKAFFPRIHQKASIPFQLMQACLVLPALAPFAARHPGPPVLLVGVGALLYLAGAVVFIVERPRLWPRVFSHHELFHVCTVFASGAHFMLLVQYLSRA